MRTGLNAHQLSRLVGGLGSTTGPVVVNVAVNPANAAPAINPPPDGTYIPAFVPGRQIRDHRGLRGVDLKAYNDLIARLDARIVSFDKAYRAAIAAARTRGGALTPIERSYGVQRDFATQMKIDVQRAIVPYAKITNVVDGTHWYKRFDAATGTIIINNVPPPSSPDSWLEKAIDAVGDAFVWVGEQAKKYIVEKLCPYITNPKVQAIVVGSATATMAAALAPYMGPYFGKIVAGIVVAYGYQKLLEQCGVPLPAASDSGAPPATLPGPFTPPTAPTTPKYPPGTISRYNTDRGVWSIYAPKQAIGLGAVEIVQLMGLNGPDVADPVPAVPEGFVRIGEEPGGATTPPAQTSPQGTERDRRWYDSKLVWAGGACIVIGSVVVYKAKKG